MYELVEAIKHYKENHKFYAGFLFFIYSLYIIYNILSGAGDTYLEGYTRYSKYGYYSYGGIYDDNFYIIRKN
jgi:hypothetical protein